MAHRVAWILYHGKPIPDGLYIDHVSGNKQDNRISNLRLVTNQENHHNRRTAKGYTWNAQRQKWLAQITVDGKKINLGRYTNELDARAAYLRGKAIHHPSAPIQ
ncbi:HNH endonuclease signature motif containing protein [Enterobacter hormaechei]